jgi:hypothetical protein
MFPLTQDAPEVRIYTAAWFAPNLTISAEANRVELNATVRDRQRSSGGRPDGGGFRGTRQQTTAAIGIH